MHSLKDRYIVRSQHDKIGSFKFLPANLEQAKNDVKKEEIYNCGDTEIVYMEQLRQERMKSINSAEQSMHSQAFLTTSPVTQDQK